MNGRVPLTNEWTEFRNTTHTTLPFIYASKRITSDFRA